MRRTLKYVGLLMLVAVAAWAADIKISDMTAGAPAQGADAFPIARSGANYKLTVTNVQDFTTHDDARLDFVDEFSHNPGATTYIGDLFWSMQDIAGTSTNASATGVAGHPGTWSLTTGASDNNAGNFYWKGSAGVALPFLLGTSGTGTAWEARILFKTGSTVTDYAGYVGFGDNHAVNPHSMSAAIGVYWDTDTQTCNSGSHSATDFMLYSIATNDTCTTTGVTVAADTWYQVRLWSDTAGTINAAISTSGGAYSSTTTSSTNVPTIAMTPQLHVYTRTTATRAVTYDRWSMTITGISR